MRGPVMQVRVKGALAVFTEPAFKVERVSYPVMTPSAARGILEAVLWKPAIAWRIEQIAVLNAIRYTAFRRNEVNSRARMPATTLVTGGGSFPPLYADDDRSQRNTIALRDVDYLVHAHFELTSKAGAEDSLEKFSAMFNRRLEKGQHFHQPYLGCREFAADVGPPDGNERPITESRDLGWMLWDIEYGRPNRARFFRARLEHGVMRVPDAPGEVE